MTFWRRNGSGLESELRALRPEAPKGLTDALAAQVGNSRAPRRKVGFRPTLAMVLLLGLVGAVVAIGGTPSPTKTAKLASGQFVGADCVYTTPASIKITSSAFSASAAATATNAVTATVYDCFGNASTNHDALNVSLGTNSGGGTFGAVSGGSGATSVTIPASASSVTFYYGDTVAGTPTIQVSSAGLGSDTQQETITAAAVNKLVFTTVPSGNQTATSTATIGAYQVQEQDSFGNPVTAGSTVTVSLSSNSTGTKFFSLTSGGAVGTAVTSVSISSGQSTSGNFYYADTKAGSPGLTAHASGISNDGTTSPTIVAAAPAALCWVAAPSCSGTSQSGGHNWTFTSKIGLVDEFGNTATATAVITVSVVQTGTGGGVAWSGDHTTTIAIGQTATTNSVTVTAAGSNNKSATNTASASSLTSATFIQTT